jgi:hypothetical protein
MAQQVLNIINQFMAYTPVNGITDNPVLRNFDWSRRIYSIPVDNAQTEVKLLPPNETLEIFSGIVPHNITTAESVELQLLGDSVYRLRVTSAGSFFRNKRAITGLTTCEITLNNQTIAFFDFNTATLNAVVGDTLRCKGYNTKDSNIVWNVVNTGDWVVIGVNGSVLTCKRPLGQPFQAIEESATISNVDLEIFASSGVQIGNSITLEDNFLIYGKQSFIVQDVTPETIDFLSGEPLPVGIITPYIANQITLNNKTKRFLYVESNNSVAIQLNGDTGSNFVVEPITYNDVNQPGFFTKFGAMSACSVKNLTLEPAMITFLMAE